MNYTQVYYIYIREDVIGGTVKTVDKCEAGVFVTAWNQSVTNTQCN